MYTEFSDRTRTFVFTDKTESTNNDVKKAVYASSSPVFTVLAADSQYGGRGRLGRQFFSPDGGLYFSISFPLTGRESNIPFLTLLVGLAVSEAIEEITGLETSVKWPNDIYLNGKKLGGILCELVCGKYMCAVAGIGINLGIRKEDIPAELSGIMTSFAAEGVVVPDKKQLIKKIVNKTDEYIYEKHQLNEVSDENYEKIRLRSFSIGKKVRYILEDTVCEGVVTDIKKNGAAEILFADGTKKEIFCGEIVQ